MAQTIKNNIKDAEILILRVGNFVFFRLIMDNKISRPNIPNFVLIVIGKNKTMIWVKDVRRIKPLTT